MCADSTIKGCEEIALARGAADGQCWSARAPNLCVDIEISSLHAIASPNITLQRPDFDSQVK